MNEMLGKISLYLAGFLAFFITTVSAETPSTQLDTELQNSIQQYLAQYHQSAHISAVQLSILIPNDPAGNPERNYVTGTQYYTLSNPATTGMMYQYGSITKEYTDVLIFQLVNQGKINTNDTLMQLLPEEFTQDNSNAWPSSWENVTINELMNMTSGIPDYVVQYPTQLSFTDLINSAVTVQKQNGCTFAIGCFPAGSNWYYSNTNYILLGLIVERLTGMDFATVFNQNILSQFSDQNVYYDQNYYPANILPNMVRGYFAYPTLNGYSQLWLDWTDANLSWTASAGALTGNMQTLVSMTNTLYDNALQSGVPVNDLEQNLVQVPGGAPVTNVQSQCAYNPNNGDLLGSCFGNGLITAYDSSLGQFWWYMGQTAAYHTILNT